MTTDQARPAAEPTANLRAADLRVADLRAADLRAADLRALRVPITVERVQVLSLELPLVRQFRSAYGVSVRKRNLLVRLEDADGVVGWGEAPGAELPTYSPDTHDSTWYALTSILGPKVAGRSFDGPSAVVNSWREIVGYHTAKHAVECAAWSIVSQKLGQSLSRMWGGVRDGIPTGESFGIRDHIAELHEDIEKRLAEGYCRIKLKIEPGWDVDVVRSVAAQFPGIPLSVDGNCGYDAADDGPWRELDELNLLMIEQPFARDALCELADMQRTLNTPVCLDESATSPGITGAALRLGCGRIVNIKPPRLGGIFASVVVHDMCSELGIPVWCGGMLETGIGRGFNLALASLPHFTLPADMSPAKLFYAEDLIEPSFDIRSDGTIAVPTGLGCGFNVAEDRIASYAIANWTSE
jgi:o-succinylbenzoate synthase